MRWYFLVLLIISVATLLHGQEKVEFVSIEILPPHVGTFYELGEQQFEAWGVRADGTKEDITQQVDWSVEAYPFESQTAEPHEVVTIDQNGKATIHDTWGRVRIRATYPKTKQPTVLSHIYELLFKKKPVPTVPIDNQKVTR